MFFILLSLGLSEEVSLKNNFIRQTWLIESNKLKTKEILNYRTDPQTLITPGDGSEEFIIAISSNDHNSYPKPMDKSRWTTKYIELPKSQSKTGSYSGVNMHKSLESPSNHQKSDNTRHEHFRLIINTNKMISIRSISCNKISNGFNRPLF